jgi:hypothetical protein
MRQLRTGRARRRWVAAVPVAGLAAVTLGLGACSSGQPAAGATGTSCGTTRTGANVPVEIKVAKGSVDCGTVMRVESSYAAMIEGGDVRGNGGGAPITVGGWICQGYPTPQVLRTGDASECHTASAEVVAVLALPSSGS